MARPTDYNSKIHPKIAKKLASKCFIDSVIADFLGISVPTFIEWKKKHPEFNDAIRQGKDKADKAVISKLYQRAIGYDYEEVTEITDPKGQVTLKVKHKEVIPSIPAQKLWLINRRPDEWRDTQHIEQDLGNDFKEFLENMMSKKNIPTDELLKQIEEDNKKCKEELELSNNKENESNE